MVLRPSREGGSFWSKMWNPLLGSETPKIDDFTVKMTKISPLAGRVTTFRSGGSEFLTSFGPLQNPTLQIGYPYPDEHDVPQNAPCLPLDWVLW